ncbi:MAG TPA: MBL fold metallo-hydrolase [Anaeromyxobacteraceae bacterium]|nr:MBL fold metallo-hydrolase [Anaeromyxobacteraceae bacterium]
MNLDGTGPRGFGAVLRWSVLDRLQGRRRRPKAKASCPRVAPDLLTLRTPPRPGEGARLTFIGHATYLVQLDNLSLLVDPVFSERIARFIPRRLPPGVPVERLPPIDAALVSHGHYDHLDRPTLERLGVPVYGGLGLARDLAPSGLTCVEMGWGASSRIGDVKVTFVPSQHWSRRGLFDTNRALWGGFVLEGSSATVYHAGDSGYFEGFAEIGRRFAIDAALLPIGAYDPPWFMSSQHMNPEEALRAFADLGARTLFAMHFGTFQLSDEPLDEPPERLLAASARLGRAKGEVRVLAVGETAEVAHTPKEGRARPAGPPRRDPEATRGPGGYT